MTSIFWNCKPISRNTVRKQSGVKNGHPNDCLSDIELLQLSKKGHEDAFVTLYRRHQGSVFRFAYHMSGSRDCAEEVTQEVFLALMSDLTYRGDRGPLQGYLIGMARNQVRRQLQQSRRWLLDERIGKEDYSFIEGLDKEEEIALLRQAILRLPTNYREVIVLCDLENIHYARAARQLGCAVGTVRSRLHRARAILRARLRQVRECSV
jgi:RNA polymerase sigma-70 factor, ECF subfamily